VHPLNCRLKLAFPRRRELELIETQMKAIPFRPSIFFSIVIVIEEKESIRKKKFFGCLLFGHAILVFSKCPFKDAREKKVESLMPPPRTAGQIANGST